MATGTFATGLCFAVGFAAVSGCQHAGICAHAPAARDPRLLYSWWSADTGTYAAGGVSTRAVSSHSRSSQRWFGACAVGFPSTSEALAVLPSGPVCIGGPNGTPLFRFDDAQVGELAMRFLQAYSALDLRATQATVSKGKAHGFRGAGVIITPRNLPILERWRGIRFLERGCISRDGRFAAAVAQLHGNNCVALWNATSPSWLRLLDTSRNLLPCAVAFSPSGSQLAVGYNPIPAAGPVCIVWDMRSGKAALTLSRQETWPGYLPSGIAYLPNHRLAITGGGKLLLADIKGKGHIHLVPKPKNVVFTGALLASPSRQHFIAAMGTIGMQPNIAICSGRTGYILRRIPIRFAYANLWYITQLVAGGHQHDVVAALSSKVDGGVGFFCEMDLKTGRMIWRSPEIIGGCMSIAVSPDGRAAITGGPQGAELWRLPAAAPRR